MRRDNAASSSGVGAFLTGRPSCSLTPSSGFSTPPQLQSESCTPQAKLLPGAPSVAARLVVAPSVPPGTQTATYPSLLARDVCRFKDPSLPRAALQPISKPFSAGGQPSDPPQGPCVVCSIGTSNKCSGGPPLAQLAQPHEPVWLLAANALYAKPSQSARPTRPPSSRTKQLPGFQSVSGPTSSVPS